LRGRSPRSNGAYSDARLVERGAAPKPPGAPGGSGRPGGPWRPSIYAARPPSSVSAVMTYVPLFSSRSRVTIFCLAASSRSFEKVEKP